METKRGKLLSLYSSPEAFRSGMQGIASQGMTVKESHVSAYRQGVDGKAEVRSSAIAGPCSNSAVRLDAIYLWEPLLSLRLLSSVYGILVRKLL